MSGCRSSSDVVFVLDSSSAVDYPSFQSVKSFLSDLVLDLAVDSGQTRVGLVTYSGDVLERFNLVRYTRRDDMSAAISAMTYTMVGGYRTGTANAIAYVRQVTVVTAQITIHEFLSFYDLLKFRIRTALQYNSHATLIQYYHWRS